MVEIRMHGRGGQGAVIASQILAAALFKEGKYVQAFPAFGVERRGAPVTAFLRMDDRKIWLKSEIYEPDHVVVLDAGLIETVDVTAGLKDGGWVIINSEKPPGEFRLSTKYRVATVDASSIAIRHRLGSRTAPIVNTAILGAFARSTGLVGIDAVVEAVKNAVPTNKEANARATREAYDGARV
ncbi:MAG: 2-oxoacid:acceptor oxidoreductase family protein [Chloroflexi bacterium]|nr:2-oxoacid:acceptor oxidoreductase family protein [Chloroflexota bacterium]